MLMILDTSLTEEAKHVRVVCFGLTIGVGKKKRYDTYRKAYKYISLFDFKNFSTGCI